MSQGTKNFLVRSYQWVRTEIRQGNYFVIIALLASLYLSYQYVVKPELTYWVEVAQGANDATAIIALDNYQLRQEMEKFKEEVRELRASEPFGIEIKGQFGVDYKDVK